MDVRKAVRWGGNGRIQTDTVAGPVGVDSCRPAASESGVSSSQVEIDYWPAGSRRNCFHPEPGSTSTTSTRR